MLNASLTILIAFLPLLASATHKPPHLRHRHLSESSQRIHNRKSEPHAIALNRSNQAHTEAHRIIKRQMLKRGTSCKPRQVTSDSLSSVTSISISTTTYENIAAVATAGSTSTSLTDQSDWSKQVRLRGIQAVD